MCLVLQTATWGQSESSQRLGLKLPPPAILGTSVRWGCGLMLLFPFAGVLKFARLVKSYEAQDPEIASLSGKLKALFLPPMTLPPHGPASGGSVAAS